MMTLSSIPTTTDLHTAVRADACFTELLPRVRPMLFEDLFPTRARQHAQERPNERCLFFLDDRLDVVESLTYRQLDERARAVAAALVERDLVGAPVVLSFPPGLDFVTAFTGCLYAGAIAVPATLPRSHRSGARLTAILDDSDARCVLTDS